MVEPQTLFGKWVFPILLVGLASLILAGAVAVTAIEMRRLKDAEAERTWINEQLVTPD